MKVVFETNHDNSGEKGFKAVFSSDDVRVCGGDFDVTPTEHDILIQETFRNRPRTFSYDNITNYIIE